MNKRQAENWNRVQDRLMALGFSRDEVEALFRIERTLQRWGELECGNSNDYRSWAIERDEATGKPFMVTHYAQGKPTRHAVADRERGALKRLETMMLKRPELAAYHQGDPRGCALYIVQKSDLRGQDIDSVYTRGVAVCI